MPKKYIMWGSYCENALEKRTPYRQAHLAGLTSQKEQGILVTLGPTKDNTKVFGIVRPKAGTTIVVKTETINDCFHDNTSKKILKTAILNGKDFDN